MTFRISPRVALLLAASIPVTAVVAVVWTIVWATHYAPLVPGSLFSGIGPHGTMVKAAAGSGGKDVVYVDQRQGSTFQVAFSIRNAGGHGVTLLGPPKPGPMPLEGLFPVLSASIGPHDLNMAGPGDHLGGGHYPRQFRALTASHSASLRAGDDRLVYFTLRMNGRCRGGGVAHDDRGATVEAVDSIPMRYRVAGLFTRTQWLPLPFNLALACHGSGISVG